MNISLPGDLKQRLDAIPVRVNWSAVAARAFRHHLDQLNCGDPSHQIIERRSKSNGISEDELRSEGMKAGRAWAARVAESSELERLEQARDTIGKWRFCNDEAPGSAAEGFFFTIEPESNGNRSAAVEFWETATRWHRLPDDAYVQDFASGAIICDGFAKERLGLPSRLRGAGGRVIRAT